MKSFKTNLLRYFLELLIVAFGVFLGIYVSEWKANQQVEENVRKSLQYITDELQLNQENLAKSINYHELIKVNVKKLSSNLDVKDLVKPYVESEKFHVMKIEGWSGVELPSFKTIAYEGAKINNVFHELDFELVQQIAGAYQTLAFNQEFGNSVLKKMLNTNSETKVLDVVGSIDLLTSDYLNSEKVLHEELSATISYIRGIQE